MSAGEAAQVTCMVSVGDQPLDISWSFEGTNVSSMMGVSTTKVGRKASLLMIDPISAGHRGNYTCTVRNPAGTANFTASLNINGKISKKIVAILLSVFYFVFVVSPKIVPFHFEDPIFAGQSAQVTCLASEGDLPLEINWFFQHSNISSLNGVSTTKIGKRASLLLIEPSSYEHNGNYTCMASNKAGRSNYTAILNINGKIFA